MIYRFLMAAVLILPAPAFSQEAPSEPKKIQALAPTKLPVEAFANLPFVENAVISPDGNNIAGLFSVRGEQRVVLMPLDPNAQGRAAVKVPEGTQAGGVRWVGNDNVIVTLTGLLPVVGDLWYVNRLIGINRNTGEATKLLWDLNGQNTADVIWVPSDGSTEILVGAQKTIYSNEADFWPTVYRVNVTTGKKRQEIAGRTNFSSWGADSKGYLRVGVGYNDDTLTSRAIYRSETKGVFKEFDRANHKKDEGLTVPFMFIPGGDNALIMRDDDDGNTNVFEIDMATQKTVKTVYKPTKGEVLGAFSSYDDTKLLGVYTSDPEKPLVWLDPALAELQANFSKSVLGSNVSIESINADQTKMLVRIASSDNPGTLYVYNTQEGVLRKIASVNEQIGGKRLSPVKMIKYKARDGLEIEAVLTLPKGKQPKNLPFIVMPHGGPWSHDTLNYDYWTQFLASRGYAVLQPNFRGSTGYGTKFTTKGEGQMGFAMQDDITDGVKWAVDQGIANKDKICIVGASYGGYAAMWGVAKDPDLYRCAISIAGVAALRREVNDFGNSTRGNLFTMQWKAMTPDFAAVSPINAVDRIKVPLLLIHGKKDVTVDHVQSVKMNSAMLKAKKQVEFVSIPLADHYFTRQDDRVTLLKSMEAFLAKHNPVE